MNPLHIVAVGAHPDDIELSMAALSIGAAGHGQRTTWIVATDGAAGSGRRDPALAQRREAEARAGAAVAGAELVWLGMPDGQLAWCLDGPRLIGEQLAALAPDLILTHATNDYHADHRAVARLVGDTASIGTPILRCDTMLGLHFLPDLLVDISGQFSAKLEALGKHESQSALGIGDAAAVWNRFRGLQSSGRQFIHAEAYAVDCRLGIEARSLLDRLADCVWL